MNAWDRCAKESPVAPGPVTMQLTPEELALLIEALDSHEYWQLSESHQRNNGASQIEDGADAAIDDCRDLSHRLSEAREGRETPPGVPHPPYEDEDEDTDEDDTDDFGDRRD